MTQPRTYAQFADHYVCPHYPAGASNDEGPCPYCAETSYADLVAARDAGDLTNLDLCAGVRVCGHRAEHAAAMAAQRAEAEAARLADYAERAARLAEAYSTAALEADVATGGEVSARRAAILLKLDTVEQRLEAVAGSNRFLNATPDAGRPSDALRTVVHSMLSGYPA